MRELALFDCLQTLSGCFAHCLLVFCIHFLQLLHDNHGTYSRKVVENFTLLSLLVDWHACKTL